eukprot:SAG22_NODE_13837_length_393_cov_1.057823_1_plen_111_part_10
MKAASHWHGSDDRVNLNHERRASLPHPGWQAGEQAYLVTVPVVDVPERTMDAYNSLFSDSPADQSFTAHDHQGVPSFMPLLQATQRDAARMLFRDFCTHRGHGPIRRGGTR